MGERLSELVISLGCAIPRGVGLLVDAFIHLNDSSLTLAIAGTMGGGDYVYVAGLKKKLEKAGLGECVEWFPDLDRQGES